jgi:hypothetical protein
MIIFAVVFVHGREITQISLDNLGILSYIGFDEGANCA